MARAYVLIEAAIGKGRGIVSTLRAAPGVVAADAITGPYDVVVVLEAETPAELSRLIRGTVQTIDGVTRTLTCMVLED